MRCLQLDFSSPEFEETGFAIQIRLGYLLSDMMNVVGSTSVIMTIENVVRNQPLPKKAKNIYNSQLCNPDMRAYLENYFDLQKQLKSLKHPNNIVFLNFKKIEKSLELMIDEWMYDLEIRTHRHGFAGLDNLFKRDVFEVHNIGGIPGVETESHVAAWDVLYNEFPVKARKNSIWLMPTDFYHENYFETLVATSIDMIEEGVPYLIRCFNFPNMNSLTPTQLASVKTQLSLSIQSFKKACDEWATLCYKSNGREYFLNQLMPTLPELSAAIDDNPVLNHVKSIQELQCNIIIYMGEVSPMIIWKFYKENKVITEEEFNMFESIYGTRDNFTFPIMLFTNEYSGFELGKGEFDEIEEKGIEEEDIVAVKKTYQCGLTNKLYKNEKGSMQLLCSKSATDGCTYGV